MIIALLIYLFIGVIGNLLFSAGAWKYCLKEYPGLKAGTYILAQLIMIFTWPMVIIIGIKGIKGIEGIKKRKKGN